MPTSRHRKGATSRGLEPERCLVDSTTRPHGPLALGGAALERRAKHADWLLTFEFSDRDWDRIKAQAVSVAAGASVARLDDLDAPYRVLAVLKTERWKPNGEVLGSYAGCVLMYWAT